MACSGPTPTLTQGHKPGRMHHYDRRNSRVSFRTPMCYLGRIYPACQHTYPKTHPHSPAISNTYPTRVQHTIQHQNIHSTHQTHTSNTHNSTHPTHIKHAFNAHTQTTHPTHTHTY